jgi:hypothetical protein
MTAQTGDVVLYSCSDIDSEVRMANVIDSGRVSGWITVLDVGAPQDDEADLNESSIILVLGK